MKNSVLIMTLILFSTMLSAQDIRYPETFRSDDTDDYHGTKVADPYRWLEDENSDETKKWVEQQNAVTNEYLDQISMREKIRVRLQKLWNYEKSGIPFKKGPWVFCFRNTGLQNQSILFVREGYDGEERVLLDPNNLSEDGTTALSDYSISKDYKYMAFSTSKGGSDWNDIQILEIKTGKMLPDAVKWTKFSGIAWYKDGFFYSAYDVKDESKSLSTINEFHKVFYHKLGTSQAKDVLIYENKDYPLRNYGVFLDEDEKYMFLSESEGTSGNALWFRAAGLGDTEWIKIADGFEYDYNFVGVIENKFYILTNEGAPNNRLISVDPANPSVSSWRDVIPESEHVLQSVSHINKKLVVNYLEHASDRIYIYSATGKQEKKIELPGIGTLGGPSGNRDESVFFYSYTSYTMPNSIFRYDMKTGSNEKYWSPTVDFKPEDFTTTQVFFKSKDGTQIPMFLTYRNDMIMDGKRPVLLYGYGGFNISLTPGFRLTAIPFLEAGGIYAVVNLRGGGEYGKKWHDAGTKHQKQNVFDDFIGAAEYLIENKYTNPSKIAIQGGSNGGLLVGACMTQRPDLFKVALPAVGVMDMLRFQKFTIGWAWTGDYGSSDNQEDFDFIYKYSPLHNIKEGVQYPATLVTTADHDDRVVPAHSYKFISELQYKHRGENPVLIRIETMAGHGAGKPTSKQIDEAADILSFILFNLDVDM
ncbi:MAG: prolyl endopeptidase [Bacteroidetes bacterium GWF2_43_63]|nr:MAG: prolyl endopeptidase [Bacteroidetes bacterium GWE2_42_42]OFY54906.1 MAG: prolyl endopeptidase [Bacteroidetes bacterium GWF2_43_63]HCB63185.1 S9 family peptidase [Bacteroidales bacterium]HCY22210.1 S9 family peptidase [Bacteroidales bacterium]